MKSRDTLTLSNLISNKRVRININPTCKGLCFMSEPWPLILQDPEEAWILYVLNAVKAKELFQLGEESWSSIS